MKDVTVDFIEHAFNPLIEQVSQELEKNKDPNYKDKHLLMDNHPIYYFFLIGFCI